LYIVHRNVLYKFRIEILAKFSQVTHLSLSLSRSLSLSLSLSLSRARARALSLLVGVGRVQAKTAAMVARNKELNKELATIVPELSAPSLDARIAAAVSASQ
jgi:hypothetical protein